MGLDMMVETLGNIASVILPIVAVIALIFFIVLLYRLIKTMNHVNALMSDLSTTLQSATRQINALDGPIHTLNELSETVDQVHEVSRNLVRSALVAVIENLNVIKEWIAGKVKHDERNEEESVNK